MPLTDPRSQAVRRTPEELVEHLNSFELEMKFSWSTTHPDRDRGWLEAYLIRMRALHPEKLSPLADLTAA